MRILLIEDDRMIGEGLLQTLTDANFVVDWVSNGMDGEEAIRSHSYSTVLLDLKLPEKPGLEVLRAVRNLGNKTPILIISAAETVDMRLIGLDAGADDYLVKPFDARELISRIRALARRSVGQASSKLTNGAMALDVATNEVIYKGRIEVLPPREFALLRTLVAKPATVFSRAQLEESIYGWGQEVESNAVEVLIYYIRRRFGKDIILNVRGVGWKVAKDIP
ncbi:MAG: response regulator transcription factor [Aestuariivirga sp.]|jgi:DNA-binding response OmpR family regulator